jgi:predicted dehydrogenase
LGGQRVGLIGFGLAGAVFHAPLIARTPGLSLAAIVTANDERRAAASRSYPKARLVSSVDELLSSAADLDVVVVASPNGNHVEHAVAAIDAGLSVVVDKPFAATAAQGRELIEAAGRRGVMITPFHNRRWDGDFLTVRALMDAGRFGEIARFESRFERWRVVPKPRWMEPDAAARGEGMLFDLHTHLIDQALVLFGPVTHVYAEADRRRAGVQVDDDSFVALTHTSGVRSHLKATIVAAEIGPRYRVYGDRGAFVKFGVDPQEETLKTGLRPGDANYGEDAREQWGTFSDGERREAIPTECGRYQEFYAGVREALVSGAAPPVDASDAVAGLGLIEAAYTSSRERRVVEVGA